MGSEVGFRPFNYSVRKLQASLLSMQGTTELDVRVFDFFSVRTEALVDEVEAFDPDFIGCSTYVWSLPTFCTLAETFKRRRSDRVVVFGGPSARPAMLSLEPFARAIDWVDALCLGEGEEIIREMVSLPALSRASLATVAGLAVPDGARWVHTPERPRIADLDALASPQQMGLVRRGVTAHLESFRGCPFTCTFCEWGVLGSVSPVFGEEYLEREMRAIEANGAQGAFSIDAALNLNPRAFRNLKAAHDKTRVFERMGFHCELYPSHAMDEHLEFLKGIPKVECAIGLQSFDPEVLARLERPFDPARFDRVFERIASVASPTLLIIMGLPGDTPQSFRRTFDRARQYGCDLHVYHCLVLPDALMTRAPADFDMRFDPYTLKMYSCRGWSEEDFRREWDHVGDVMTRAGGQVIPMYYGRMPASNRKASSHRRPETTDHERAKDLFDGFRASGKVATQGPGVSHAPSSDGASLVQVRRPERR